MFNPLVLLATISVTPIDFSVLLSAVFDYVNQLMPVFAPVAAIGIGFSLVLGIISWLGGLLSKVFKARG